MKQLHEKSRTIDWTLIDCRAAFFLGEKPLADWLLTMC